MLRHVRFPLELWIKSAVFLALASRSRSELRVVQDLFPAWWPPRIPVLVLRFFATPATIKINRRCETISNALREPDSLDLLLAFLGLRLFAHSAAHKLNS